jgi:hypothetical protein
VLGLLLLLLGGVGVLYLHPSWLWPPAAAPAAPAQAVVADSSKEPPAAKKAPAPFKRTANDNVAVLPESSPKISPARAPVRAPDPRFPTAEEISVGSSKTSVVASFGPPEATLSGADHGILNERLVYLQESSGKQTSVYLMNGKVIGALTYLQ